MSLRRQEEYLAEELELAHLVGGEKLLQHQPAEQLREHKHRQKELWLA
jgi:hypothetical protein